MSEANREWYVNLPETTQDQLLRSARECSAAMGDYEGGTTYWLNALISVARAYDRQFV